MRRSTSPLVGLIGPYPELAPDHVGDEHAHGLTSSAGGPDGAVEEQRYVLGAVRVLVDLDPGDAHDGRDQYTFGEYGKSHAHRLFDGQLPTALFADGLLDQLLGDDQGHFFAAFDTPGYLPYALGQAFHMPVGQLRLHPGRQVLGLGDLHLQTGVHSPGACLDGQGVAALVLLEKVGEISAHGIAAGQFLQRAPPSGLGERRIKKRLP